MMRFLFVARFRTFGYLALVTCLLCCPGYQSFAQGSEAAGREFLNFQMNLLSPEIVSFHGQQPPYEWAAVYIGTNPRQLENSEVYLKDSSVCGVGIAGGTSFQDDVTGKYEYDGEGNLTSAIYRLDDGNGAFELFSKKTFSYSASEVTYLYQLWDENSSSWVDEYEETSTFDTQGNQIEFVVREVDMNGGLENLFRESRSYDQNGRLSEVFAASWDGTAWNDTARKDIAYNALGLYTDIYDFEWNGSSWDTLSHESAGYEQFGLQWTSYLLETMTSDGLMPSIRETYNHNQDGYWTSMTRESFDLANETWQNDVREQYEYTDKGYWIGWTRQIFDGSLWQNDAQQEAINGGTSREEIMSVWDANTQSWENQYRMSVSLDQNDYLTSEIGNQAWDAGTSAWVNSNETKQCRYFWKADEVSAIDPAFSQMNCHLENPYRIYSPIACDAMNPGKAYTIRLIDLQGRTAYQQVVEGGRQISVDRRVPQGVYTLTISEDNRLRYSRKILFNQ